MRRTIPGTFQTHSPTLSLFSSVWQYAQNSSSRSFRPHSKSYARDDALAAWAGVDPERPAAYPQSLVAEAHARRLTRIHPVRRGTRSGIDPWGARGIYFVRVRKDPDALQEALHLMELAQASTGTASTLTLDLRRDKRHSAGNHCFVPGQIVDHRFQDSGVHQSRRHGGSLRGAGVEFAAKSRAEDDPSEDAAHSGIIERFKTEVKQSLRITHPNVCRVHQLASHQDRDGQPIWFLTMELLEGNTLARCLAGGGPMPFDRALVLIRQMVAGLACAHEAGIVHRDLKPGNLMLVGSASTGERLVITDFGLAVSASPREAGGFSGTPAYMAPEQASGKPVGPQTDVFALGLIICEMLTGKRLALDFSSAENCGRQVNDWLSTHPKIQSEIRPVIMRCLQFRPEDRFNDAREILARLDTGRRRSTPARAVAAGAILAALALAATFLPALGERFVKTGRDTTNLPPDGCGTDSRTKTETRA